MIDRFLTANIPGRALRLVIFWAIIAVLWLVYRPEIERPFHILDFAEFVPALKANSDWLSRTTALTEYYSSQGRFGVVSYALLSAKWTTLGWWSPAWQLARAALMLLVAALAYKLLHRLGASRLGALVGSSLFLWAPAGSDGWVRLTMAEPIAAALMFSVSLRALRFQTTRRWLVDSVFLGIACATLVLTKELLAPLLLLPVALALTALPDGSFAFPRLENRNVALIAFVALFSAAACAVVLWVHVQSPDTGYSSFYGTRMLPAAGLLAIWVTAYVPFDPLPVPPNPVWSLALFGLIAVLAFGWRFGFHDSKDRRRAPWLLAIALLLPLAGIVVYAPNPWFARFYLLPYLIGPALLLGMAATYLGRQGPRARALVVASWLVMSIYAIGGAAALATYTDAIQRRDDALISFVSDSAHADSVLFATSRPPPPEWEAEAAAVGAAPRGLGATLSRFADATGRHWPPTRDMGCDVARQWKLASVRRIAVVNLESSCSLDLGVSKEVVFQFRRVNWLKLQPTIDSTHGRVFLP